MLRMNREKKTPANVVKKNCANYNTGFNCSGVMIGNYLQQWIDKEYYNKSCKIKEGKSCNYYNNIVEPIADL
jgi:hypothetical protein